MITVKYFYSACISIATEDVTVLCDPWFTEGAYDGSWYQYPKLENPLDKLGKADVVYISHIHPDHYDPAFLHQYLDRYPETKVVIARFAENFLDKKMTGDGIPHEIADEIVVGATRVRLFPNQIENLDDIDSALAVFRDGHAVVNMNDNLYNQPQIDAIRDYCGNSIDIALLSYTGAGPYPQTYLPEGPELEAAALKKKKDFFARYETMRDALAPKVTIPFAGKYILGGKLHALNPFRGVADAVEVLSFDPRSVVLADGGDASIDTATLTPTATRTTPYDEQTSANYAASTASQPMLYETYFTMPVEAIPFQRMLPKAYQNALRRSRTTDDYYFCIPIGTRWFIMNARHGSNESFFSTSVEEFVPRSEISIDYRCLFGLLTGVLHWNNAEIGSQFRTYRVPNEYNRYAQGFLNFLHL